ncbi:Uma2 family endonuclease [Nonomuraea typhae]|uniref:Uma2 family endonuclease n=1 Tax=Nonomuraea typhae TaxID=2603600 RepID=UPI0012FBA712|nr:Uma2 family endonuclease [Nonomuraea typhae]
MSVAPIHDFGPYTIYDLDAMPDEGKRFELEDGWFRELSPSTWHDHAADRLKDVLKDAASKSDAAMYIAGGSNDVATPAGVRKPDVFVMSRDAARASIERKSRTFYSGDILVIVEVVSVRSGSEQTDRVRKVREYAQAGIPQYWIVDLEPTPKIVILELVEGTYRLAREAKAGQEFTGDFPFPFSFDPGTMTDLE